MRISREIEALRREIRDLAKSAARWQEDHEKQHRDDAKTAVSSRRWVVSACLTSVGLLIAMLTIVLQLLGRAHG